MSVANPKLMVQYSKDGGMTWSAEIWIPLMGADKKYEIRHRLMNIGSCQQLMFKIRCSENIPLTFVSAHADVEFGI